MAVIKEENIMIKKSYSSAASTPPPSFKATAIKIIAMALVLGGIFIFIFDYVATNHMEATEQQRLMQLKQLVQIAVNTIEPVLADFRSGQLSREKAIGDVRALVRRMTFREDYGSNYIFMSTYKGIMLVQPFEPEREMTDQWNLQDSKGAYIIRKLVAAAQKKKSGAYVSYHFNRPGSEIPEEKVSYVMGIPELECYIGAGCYMGELNREQAAFRWKIIALESIMLFFLVLLILSFINEIWRRNKKLRKEVDIRRKSELALLESERKLSTLIANIPGVTYRCACDVHWTMEFFSKGVEQITGYPVSDFLNNQVRSYASIIHPDDRKMVEDNVMAGVRQHRPFTIEYRIIHADGNHRWVFEKGQGVFSDNESLSCLDGVIVDITELKETEEALGKSEAHLRTLIETIPDLVWLKDPQGVYISCNPKFERFFGAKESEIVGKTDYDFLDRTLADFFREKDKAVMLANKSITNEEEVKYADDGHGELLETIKTPMYDDDGHFIGVLGIARDITERKQAEKELKKAQSYIANIINSMPSLLVGVDMDGSVTKWNKKAEQITGMSADVAVGKKIFDVLPHLIPEMEKISESIRSRKIKREEKRPRVWKEETFYEDVTIYPLITDGADGAVIRIDDVTDKVRMEERLRQSQKMDAIGQLAGGVAHDFNNMLGGIMGAAQLLDLPGRGLDEKGKKYVDMIMHAAMRAAELTAKLLAFGRKGTLILKEMTAHGAIDDAVSILNRTIDKKIRISVRKRAANHMIVGDNAGLQNVLINIVINAAHAMPDGGEVIIATQNVLLNEIYCNASPFKIDPGEYIEIEIKDTGCGIPLENIQKIFEPFYTTKEKGEGTGLGLSAVYGMVQDHRGALNVYSEVGVGSAFHILLPCGKKNVVLKKTKDHIISGSGQILLVDDEEIIRVTGKLMLESMGYRVILAENGYEALEIFKSMHADIDIVLMDMIMPRMNGREAFFKMKEIDKACCVIISSGFVESEGLDELKKKGIAGFLKKPFVDVELSQILAEVLKTAFPNA